MTPHLQVVVGLGETGLSCIQYCVRKNIPVAVTDSRERPPCIETFQKNYSHVPSSFGKFDSDLINQASTLVVSPGVSLQEPVIQDAIGKNIPIIGDIELFAREVRSPVIAITGTNAKSTVTTLVGKMAAASGLRVGVGGNLGPAALTLFTTPLPELFVLELSSFQLEMTHSLSPYVATILNVTEDHMDRYADFAAYRAAKQRIYTHCHLAVCNRDDPFTECEASSKNKLYFTLQEPDENEFGLREKNHEMYLALGKKELMRVSDLPILGKHYQANALAALALGHGFGLPMEPMLKVLREFQGLTHRCQLVREYQGVRWYNDSKGTNVGATLAAINGLGGVITGKLILIAGGIGKNADFSPLVPAIKKYVRAVVLIGEAAPVLAKIMDDQATLHFANSMEEAILISKKIALSGDSVLLSPACASFDMFKNFEHRGDVFSELVKGLPAC